MSFAGQVLHVFRRDVVRYWPALLGVAALMLIHRTAGLPGTGTYVRPFDGTLPVFALIFGLFTVLVVQDQRVAGDTGFWSTRPLHGLAILGGKALFVGLFFCVVPVAVQVQWLEALAGGGDTTLLFSTSMLYQGGYLALVAAAASVTSNLTAFCLLAVPTWVGLEVLGDRNALTFGGPLGGETIEISLRWAWLLVGTLALVHQHTTRRTSRTVAGGLAALAVLTPLAYRGHLDLTHDPLAIEHRGPYPRADEIGLRPSSLSHDIQKSLTGPAQAVLTFSAAPTGGPGVMLDVDRGHSVFLVDGAPLDEFRHRTLPSSRAIRRSLNRRMPLGDIPPAGQSGREPYQPNGLLLPVFRGSGDEAQALHRADSLEVTVDIDVFTQAVRTSVALEPGATLNLKHGRFTVVDVTRAGPSLIVDLGYVLAVASGDYRALDAMMPQGLRLYDPHYHEYTLFGTGSVGSGARRPDAVVPQSYFVGGSRLEAGVRASATDLTVLSPRDADLPADWGEEAELLLTEYVYEGSFRRTFSMPLDGLPDPMDVVRFPRPDGPASAR